MIHTQQRSKTGNVAVDTVVACLLHEKRFGKKVESIMLSQKYWVAMMRYMKEAKLDMEIKDQFIFGKVTFFRGNAFMTENLEVKHVSKLSAVKKIT